MFNVSIREWMNTSTAVWVIGSIWVLSLIENNLIVSCMNLNTNWFTRTLTRVWNFLFERAGWVTFIWMLTRMILTSIFAAAVILNMTHLGWNRVLLLIVTFITVIGIGGVGIVSSLAAYMEIA